MNNQKLYVGVILVLSLTAASCGLHEIKEQTTAADNTGVVKGKIEVKSEQKGPIIVLGFEDKGGVLTRKYHIAASEDGKFQFVAEPGVYAVAAFIDVNKDGNFQRGLEHGNFNSDPLTFDLPRREEEKGKEREAGEEGGWEEGRGGFAEFAPGAHAFTSSLENRRKDVPPPAPRSKREPQPPKSTFGTSRSPSSISKNSFLVNRNAWATMFEGTWAIRVL